MDHYSLLDFWNIIPCAYFLLSHSPFLRIINFPLGKKCAVCELWCSESSSSPVQMSSTPCSIFKPKQKDWCTGHRLIWVCFHKNSYWSWLPTIALKLLPPTLLCLWLQVHHSFGLCLNSDHSLSFRLKVSWVSVALPVRSSSESAPLPVCSPFLCTLGAVWCLRALFKCWKLLYQVMFASVYAWYSGD